MLIQFSVKNWRSIRDEQTLTMVKAKSSELEESNTFAPKSISNTRLLRSAVIYGANAAGKSNLISALRTMKSVVQDSAGKQSGDELPVTPFRLDNQTLNAPSEFEVIFITDGIKYQYGFTATKNQVHEEWLIAYPNNRAQKWFARALDLSTNEHQWQLGSALTGQKQLWVESTRSNALFLSTATQLNSQQLKPVYDWFKSTLRISGVSGWTPTYTAKSCDHPDRRVKVLDFLKAADLDIKDLTITSEKYTVNHLPEAFPEEMKKTFVDKMKDTLMYDIKTVHENAQGDLVEFDFHEESDGTRKLFSFAGPWLDVLSKGRVLFVDELHDNLHPKLVSFLVSLFHSEKTNPNNAQLVFTTHETSILNQDVFRRDQIWFCEKEKDQSTRLYPLTDFSPRKGRENLEAAYLSGRYGALPYIRNLVFKETNNG